MPMIYLTNQKKSNMLPNPYHRHLFYEGEWKDGKKHGYGLYKYYDGTIYEGEWKDGKKHGEGTYYNPFGNTYL